MMNVTIFLILFCGCLHYTYSWLFDCETCRNAYSCSTWNGCSCHNGWTGTLCDQRLCSSYCKNGYCSTSTNCVCNAGWKGYACDQVVSCTVPCVNGKCVGDVCSCSEGWIGSACDEVACTVPCVNGDCKGDVCTCNEGWIGSACDRVACSIPCVNGNCQEDVCTCYEGWRGNDCNEVSVSIKPWCASIEADQINNEILNSFPDQVEVDCSSPNFEVSTQELETIGLKIAEDSVSPKATLLYSFWKQHPSLRKYCCFSGSGTFETYVKNMIDFGDNFQQYVPMFTTSALRKEIDNICPINRDDSFCLIKPALHIIDGVAVLPESKSEWTSTDELYKDIILLNSEILAKERPLDYSSLANVLSVSQQEMTITKVLDVIISDIQNLEFDSLKAIHKFLPRLYDYTQTTSSCNSENICIFMKIVAQVDSYVEQLKVYDNSLIINGKKRILLNTGTNYIEFLKQTQLDRILQVIGEQEITTMSIATELKGQISNQFSEIRSYYEQVGSFNGDIAVADLGYIKGRLHTFKQRITSVVGIFKEKMSTLLIQMMVGAGLEVVNAAITLALAFADFCNPFGFIFGGADPKSLIDAVNDVANAAAQLTQGIAVQSAWKNAQTKAFEINNKFEKNNDFLKNVKTLIFEESETREDFEDAKNIFLEQYNNYDPQVLPDDLVGMTSLWSGLVEAACDVTNSFNTAAGIVAAAVIKGQNLCVDLPVLADRMGELYENIYDYQFDMMDALAEYTRAKVTIDAAKEITTELTTITNENPEDEETQLALELTGGLSFVTYKTHLLQAINRYCNILQYSDGDIKPKECDGPSTDIALLVSKAEQVCTSTIVRYYQVPTAPSGSNDSAYVDISELYKGATVNFKIPNSQWLIDHKWIREDERDMALFVEQLQVYLPMKPKRPTDFYVTADPILQNQITPATDATEYMIVPHVPLVSEYIMGPRRTSCPNQKTANPYTSCDVDDTSSVCPLTQNIYRSLYPSLYSHWTITVKGGEHLIPPNPASDMSVYFSLKLCKMIKYGNHNKAAVPAEADQTANVQEVSDCCSTGMYRPEMDSDCIQCPEESHSALNGYYCEKN